MVPPTPPPGVVTESSSSASSPSSSSTCSSGTLDALSPASLLPVTPLRSSSPSSRDLGLSSPPDYDARPYLRHYSSISHPLAYPPDILPSTVSMISTRANQRDTIYTGTGGYSAISPSGSYQSYPGTRITTTTRSSVDEGSVTGRASGLSPSGMVSSSDSSRVSGIPISDSSRGYDSHRMGGSDGSRGVMARERVPSQLEDGREHGREASHTHSASASTIVGSSPQTQGGRITDVQSASMYSGMGSEGATRVGYRAQTGYVSQASQDPYGFAQQRSQMQNQMPTCVASQGQYQTGLTAPGLTGVHGHGEASVQSRAAAQSQASMLARSPLYSVPSNLVRTSVKRSRVAKRPRPSPSSRARAAREDFDSDDESDDDESPWAGSGGSPTAGFNFGYGAGGGTGELGGPSSSGAGQGVPGLPGGRRIGACTHCKRLKMKCDFPEGANVCKRCNSTGHPCIVEGRKPRTAPNKREYLMAQIRHKDEIIGSLLKQLHNPYIATPLSIDQFKMAISPSDKDNVRIADWMDRLQNSARSPGQPSAERMQMIREMRNTAAGRSPISPVIADATTSARIGMEGSGATEDVEETTTEEEEAEKVRNALPDVVVPIGLLADLSLDKDKEKDKGRGRSRARPGSTTAPGGSVLKLEDEDNALGVANKDFFKPGPANDLNIRKNLIERHNPPDIVLHGLVNPTDVEKLFDIFWKQINPFIGVLDPKLHTATSIFQRCPFLFTVICAISSRYYAEKSEIYPVAMHFAKHSAANALIDGWKSVELCQAYILMSIYAVPARRWEEDRSWLYTGLAIRIATDLNLHQISLTQPQTERQEREMLNRTRVWMICFNLDRSTATQFGKPSTIKEDYITRNSADWYKRSRYRDPYDIHLCAYSQLLRIVGQFHDEIFSDPLSPTGLNQSLDFLAVTRQHDANLTAYFEEWTMRFQEESDPNDAGCVFRCTLLPFLVSYSRLVMYSFGFQHAFQRGIEASDNLFLNKCFEAAIAVIKHMIRTLAPSGFMRSSPDGHFIFASFASAFLLKLLRPEFVRILTREMEDDIFNSIGRLITTLQDVAIDERHTPRLYARFLADLLTKHRKGGGAITGRMQQHPPASQITPQTQPHGYANELGSTSRAHHAGMYTHHGSEPEPRYNSDTMQFSLNPPPNTTGTPPPGSIQATGDSHGVVIGSGPSPDSNDVSMADILSDAGPLATMHALNDVWWANMMMPGFSWPDAPLMSSLNDGQPNGNGVPSIHPGYGGFQMPEVQLAT